MARFRDFDFFLEPPRFRTTPLGDRLLAFSAALRDGLAETNIEAPWRKLVVNVGEVPLGRVRVGPTVVGVAVADVPVELTTLVEEPETSARQHAGKWLGSVLSVAEAEKIWSSHAFKEIVRRLAEHRGPYVSEPSRLRATNPRGNGRREFRTRLTRDDSGLTIELVCLDSDGVERGRVEVYRVEGAWDAVYDFNPSRVRATEHTVEYLDSRKRVLKSIPRSFCAG